MAEREKVWVEVELCSGHGLSSYNGQMFLDDYRRIENGFTENPFIKMFNIHWYDLSDEEGWKSKELIAYGSGKYAEYDDEALIRVDTIQTIFKLKHGPKEGE